MKMILVAAALAALTTVPALAQQHHAPTTACRFLGHSRAFGGSTGPGYYAYNDCYAWTPGCHHGRPSRYAQYDQNGPAEREPAGPLVIGQFHLGSRGSQAGV